MEGKVKFFNRIKGFGFINGNDGKDYFVHISAIKENKYLNEGDEVSFESVEDEKGLKAKNVELLSKGKKTPKEEPEEEESEEGSGEESGEEPEEESEEEPEEE